MKPEFIAISFYLEVKLLITSKREFTEQVFAHCLFSDGGVKAWRTHGLSNHTAS